jgi:hypothetical protein
MQAHVVDGFLTTFGCVEWESELFRGVMRARCYPFDMPKKRFHGFNKVKLYEPSLTYLYVAAAENMVGRVPFIPCYLAGISTPTIPHMFSKRKDSGFLFGCADTAAADGRRASNVYDVNPWLWQLGRGKPRLGVLEESCARGKVQAWLGNSPASQGG